MYKMMIIDDEKYMREGLVTYIDWNSLGVEVCMTFDNAVDALEGIKNYAPDIVLSDIHMMKMDGIEMLKAIKTANYECEVIFISAYRSFEYAKEAVRYGAFDYVLKPVSKEDMADTITRCIKFIEKKVNTGNDDTRVRMERQKDLMLYLLNGENSEDARQDICRKLGVASDSDATLVIARYEDSDSENISEEEAWSICRTLEVFSEEHDFITVKLVDHEVLIFAFGGPQPAISRSLNDLTRAVNGMKEPVVIGISTSDGENDPGMLYSKASWAVLCFELGYGGKVSSYKMLRLFASNFKKAMPGALDFISAIKTGDNFRLNQLLKSFFLSLAGSDHFYDTNMVKLEVMKLFDGIFMSIGNYPVWAEIESMGSKTGFRHSISSLKSIFSIYTVAQNILNNIISVINSQQFNSSNRIINSVINLLQKDLSSDISLESIAKKLYVNPSYLSRIFSSEMSESFSHFRAKMRIERAKELLISTRYKVFEIASMVGYNDVAYFNKVFSSFEGVTPSEYREKTLASI